MLKLEHLKALKQSAEFTLKGVKAREKQLYSKINSPHDLETDEGVREQYQFCLSEITKWTEIIAALAEEIVKLNENA